MICWKGDLGCSQYQHGCARLSEVIQTEEIDRIDLLKINVEKSELDVLQGIDDRDWPKIRQIVLEVDVEANIPAITQMLERHGFDFQVSQDDMLNQTELFYIHAVRPGAGQELDRNQTPRTLGRKVSDDADSPTPEELVEYMGQQLPSYMIPASISYCGDLPLTSNGKIDHGELPAPSRGGQGLDCESVGPRNAIEEDLQRIWRDILKVGHIGIHSDFFALGGHSLLIARVRARIASRWQVKLPISRLFNAPTIAQLADEIAAQQRDSRK